MSGFPGASGLVVSAAVAGAGLILLWLQPSRRRIGGGLLAVVAAIVGLTAEMGVEAAVLAFPAALLAVGGWLTERTRWGYIITASGALLMTIPSFPDRPLFKAVCVGYILVVGWAIADMERRKGALVPVMLAVTVLGIYFTLPAAAVVLPLVGGSLAYVVVPRLGPAATMSLAGLTVWVVAVGGITRTGSIVGALACFGVLLIEPVTRVVALNVRALAWIHDETRSTSRFVVTVHLLVVVLTSRVAGFREKSEAALVLSVLALMLGWALLFYDLPMGMRRKYIPTSQNPATVKDDP